MGIPQVLYIVHWKITRELISKTTHCTFADWYSEPLSSWLTLYSSQKLNGVIITCIWWSCLLAPKIASMHAYGLNVLTKNCSATSDQYSTPRIPAMAALSAHSVLSNCTSIKSSHSIIRSGTYLGIILQVQDQLRIVTTSDFSSEESLIWTVPCSLGGSTSDDDLYLHLLYAPNDGLYTFMPLETIVYLLLCEVDWTLIFWDGLVF